MQGPKAREVIAPLVSGILLIIAQWGVTPSLGSTITPNQAVQMGNIGILLSALILLG